MDIQTEFTMKQMLKSDLPDSSHVIEKDSQTPCNYRKQPGDGYHLLPQKALVALTLNPARDQSISNTKKRNKAK